MFSHLSLGGHRVSSSHGVSPNHSLKDAEITKFSSFEKFTKFLLPTSIFDANVAKYFRLQMVLSVMSQLECIFADSYRKLDGALPVVSPETSLLHCEALSSWCLLLSLVPSSSVVIITDR